MVMAKSPADSLNESAKPLEISSYFVIDDRSRRYPQRPLFKQPTLGFNYLQRYLLAAPDAPTTRLVRLLAVSLITQWGIGGACDAVQHLSCFLAEAPTQVAAVGLANLISLHHALQEFANPPTHGVLAENHLN